MGEWIEWDQNDSEENEKSDSIRFDSDEMIEKGILAFGS